MPYILSTNALRALSDKTSGPPPTRGASHVAVCAIGAEALLCAPSGYDEIVADGIYVRDILASVNKAAVVEDYPTFPKGRAVLVLQFDKDSRPIHVVWGIPKGFTSPAVVVTAYRPDPDRWDRTFTKRRGKNE